MSPPVPSGARSRYPGICGGWNGPDHASGEPTGRLRRPGSGPRIPRGGRSRYLRAPLGGAGRAYWRRTDAGVARGRSMGRRPRRRPRWWWGRRRASSGPARGRGDGRGGGGRGCWPGGGRRGATRRGGGGGRAAGTRGRRRRRLRRRRPSVTSKHMPPELVKRAAGIMRRGGRPAGDRPRRGVVGQDPHGVGDLGAVPVELNPAVVGLDRPQVGRPGRLLGSAGGGGGGDLARGALPACSVGLSSPVTTRKAPPMPSTMTRATSTITGNAAGRPARPGPAAGPRPAAVRRAPARRPWWLSRHRHRRRRRCRRCWTACVRGGRPGPVPGPRCVRSCPAARGRRRGGGSARRRRAVAPGRGAAGAPTGRVGRGLGVGHRGGAEDRPPRPLAAWRRRARPRWRRARRARRRAVLPAWRAVPFTGVPAPAAPSPCRPPARRLPAGAVGPVAAPEAVWPVCRCARRRGGSPGEAWPPRARAGRTPLRPPRRGARPQAAAPGSGRRVGPVAQPVADDASSPGGGPSPSSCPTTPGWRTARRPVGR